MTGAVKILPAAIEVAERTGARVLLADSDLPGATSREIVNACKATPHPLSVVVILDSFDGLKWVDLICSRIYDIVLRPALAETLARTLWSAHLYAAFSPGVRGAD